MIQTRSPAGPGRSKVPARGRRTELWSSFRKCRQNATANPEYWNRRRKSVELRTLRRRGRRSSVDAALAQSGAAEMETLQRKPVRVRFEVRASARVSPSAAMSSRLDRSGPDFQITGRCRASRRSCRSDRGRRYRPRFACRTHIGAGRVWCGGRRGPCGG